MVPNLFTNNFAAILDNQSPPEQFHRVQDFLRASPIGYALIQPESISTKAVIQIWSTAEIGEGFNQVFTYAEKEYVNNSWCGKRGPSSSIGNFLFTIISLMMKSRILSNH